MVLRDSYERNAAVGSWVMFHGLMVLRDLYERNAAVGSWVARIPYDMSCEECLELSE